MTNHEEKDFHEKDRKLKLLERESIKQKAEFIMTHSDALLERIDKADENFLKSFVAFLMSNSNSDFEMNYEPNEYNYRNSLQVIFKICYALPSLGFGVDEKVNIRNKVRLYTKYFKVSHEVEAEINNQFVLLDESAYKYIIETKKYLK